MDTKNIIQEVITKFPDFLSVQDVLTKEEVEQICNHYKEVQTYSDGVRSLYDMWNKDSTGIDYQNDIDKNKARIFSERELITKIIEQAKKKLRLKEIHDLITNAIVATTIKYGYPDRIMQNLLDEVMTGSFEHITNENGYRDLLHTIKPEEFPMMMEAYYSNGNKNNDYYELRNLFLNDILAVKYVVSMQKIKSDEENSISGRAR